MVSVFFLTSSRAQRWDSLLIPTGFLIDRICHMSSRLEFVHVPERLDHPPAEALASPPGDPVWPTTPYDTLPANQTPRQ